MLGRTRRALIRVEGGNSNLVNKHDKERFQRQWLPLWTPHGHPMLLNATPRPIVTATPTYSLVSEKLRRVSAGSLQCSLFCGDQRCKYEVPHRWKEEEKALKGLFSHWVTDDILAMARPSTVLFREHDLIAQFKRLVSTQLNDQCLY